MHGTVNIKFINDRKTSCFIVSEHQKYTYFSSHEAPFRPYAVTYIALTWTVRVVRWSKLNCQLCTTRWFKYDRDWFVCKQAALRSSCVTLREWSHNLHPPSCSGYNLFSPLWELLGWWAIMVTKKKSVPVIFEPPCISDMFICCVFIGVIIISEHKIWTCDTWHGNEISLLTFFLKHSDYHFCLYVIVYGLKMAWCEPKHVVVSVV